MNKPNADFFHLGIAPDMLMILKKLKFITPTPIQQKAIPIVLDGQDIVGIAQTGTGKTLAFGIPMVQRLAADGGKSLIIVPTRELALQVADALEPLLRPFKMESVVLIGGVKMSGQLEDIKRDPDVIIATPGRMNDHIYNCTIGLAEVKILILDEADRMFDMGFEPQIKSIIRCLTYPKQTLLFSATMPPNILKLASKHMKLPVTVEIAPSGTTIKEISQELFIVKEAGKLDVLEALLRKYRGPVLIFTRTKQKASRITRKIRSLKFKVSEIHSDRSMEQRTFAMEGFKRGRYNVLVATDIAARGIDISMIELVVNFDLPDDAENYVHRIGRTGRAGKEGHAVTFATPAQQTDIQKIESLIKMRLPRTQRPGLGKKEFNANATKAEKGSNRTTRRPRHNTKKTRNR